MTCTIKYFVLLFNVCVCSSQTFEFAAVRDKDGFAFVRSSKEIRSNTIIDALQNEFIVSHFGSDANWILIDYQKNGEERSGYIYKNRLVNSSSFLELKATRSKNELLFFHPEFKVVLSTKVFDKSKHTFEFYKNNPDQLIKIDGKTIYGTDGNFPKTAYQSIQIYFDSVTIALPEKAIAGLYEPNFNSTNCYYDNVNQILYLQAINGDGAGGYVVLWVFKKGVYQQRAVTRPF